MSLRSRPTIDVSALAREFGGGGHKNMAAFSYTGNVKDLINNFVKSAIEYIDSLPDDGDNSEFVF